MKAGIKRWPIAAICENPVENAPPMRAPTTRSDMYVTLPDGTTQKWTYEQAAAFHEEVGQRLARGMRVRGSGSPPDGPTNGSTPALEVPLLAEAA